VTDAPEDKLRAAVKERATVTVKLGNNANPDDLDTKKAAARDILRLLSPWFRSYAKVEPAKHWAKVRVPTLLMIGARDLQVPADLNLEKARAALAHNRKVRAEKLPGLNHMFQRAAVGTMEEYVTLSETFNPAALELMTDWLLHTTKK
jgi:pimeloyl-ACP methyl ester carboxylesterase